MLQRLIGLETEYATLVRAPADQCDPPSRREVYEALRRAIGRRLPVAPGRYDADTIFLANGGAFSLETSPLKMREPGGLIEGATAETSSPARLVECQRAQDRLIADAAADCEIPGRVRIFKNSCDSRGHIYGCQENYSAPVARGPMLLVYWLLIAMVLPWAMLYWGVCLSVLALELVVIISIQAVTNWLDKLVPKRPKAATWKDDDSELSETENWLHPFPEKVLSLTASALRLVNLPTAILLYGIAKTVAFRRQRKYLTAFLVSRVVVTGAGHVDKQNRYRLSSKAMAIDTVTGFGGYVNERPIYVFHHWLQQLCGRSMLSLRSITELFRQRQRLQIGLSDSNVSDTAEYLKVGTTSLVLDMIEAGGGRELPRLLRPVEALHRITSDWDLIARVPTSKGEMSGLDIQRRYLRACQKYVESCHIEPEHEAYQVLSRWEQTLDALALFRSSRVDPRPSLGHVDWLTKKWLLDHLDTADDDWSEPVSVTARSVTAEQAKSKWAARKKVDIRYHELSEHGYFSRLQTAAPETCLVDPAGVEMALRLPPAGSPAVRRGQLIREFSGSEEQVRVDWSHVVIGSGKEKRVVVLYT